MTMTKKVGKTLQASLMRSESILYLINKSSLNIARSIALVFVLATTFILESGLAFADGKIWTDTNGEIWYTEDGYLWLLDDDLNVIEGWEIGNQNPDEGSGGGAPTSDDIKDYIERHHKTKLSKGERLNNPLNIDRSARGKGLDPIWIPSESAREVEGGVGSGGPGTNSGNVSDWVKGNAKKGSSNEGEDESDSGSDSERPGLGTTGSLRPEVINPSHKISIPNKKDFKAR